MGCALRQIDPEVLYHTVSKGNNGGPIARDADDRTSIRSELAAAATRYRWRVLAWCILGTHYHVVMQAPEGGFSEGFREINGNHSRRTNRRHLQVDHLFKNRPFAVEIQSEAHLVAASLYVARNPVAARLCEDAAAWAHSSYRATVGLEPAPPWLAVDRVLGMFGRTPEEARLEFARLVRNGHLPVSDTDEPPAQSLAGLRSE